MSVTPVLSICYIFICNRGHVTHDSFGNPDLRGTFDKVYYDALSDYSIGAPCAPDLLAEAGMQDGWELIEVMRKDSLDMTNDDRQTLRTAAASCRTSRLVVIHGTDTMAESAAVLADIPEKTIVLTGAMSPARFRQTDAPFNLVSPLALHSLLVTAPISPWVDGCTRMTKSGKIGSKDGSSRRPLPLEILCISPH